MNYTIRKIDRRFKASFLHGCTHKITFEKTKPSPGASALSLVFHDDWWFMELLVLLRRVAGTDTQTFGLPRHNINDVSIWIVERDAIDTIYVKDLDAFESAMVEYKLTGG